MANDTQNSTECEVESELLMPQWTTTEKSLRVVARTERAIRVGFLVSVFVSAELSS